MTYRGTVMQFSAMVPPARYGGAELVVGAFAEQLEEAGFQVHNRGLKARGEPGTATPIPNLYWPFDGRTRNVGKRLAWHAVDALTLSARSEVERLVDAAEPDVIITHNVRGWGLAPWVVAGRRGIPLVHVVHDYGLLCNASTLWHYGNDCGTVCRYRARAATRRWPGGLLVGVSEAVLSEHRARGFGGTDRSVVIHPVMAAQASTVADRERTDRAPTTFGYLGRLAPEKGISLLLDAIAGTTKQLVVAGDGERSEVERLKSRAPDRVQWLGWAEPASLFDAIDVLVVPSCWREPFGLVVVEAARAGLPVLVADQPGLIEAARASSARFHSFPANSVQALRAALDLPLSAYRGDQATTDEDSIVDIVERLIPTGPT